MRKIIEKWNWNIMLCLLLTSVLVACGSSGSDEPTADPEDETAVSVEEAPTAQPVEEPETAVEEEPEQPTPIPVEEPTALPEPTVEPEEETAVEESDPDGESITLEDGTVVFTVDDRSERLKSLTGTWNTNWNLRTIDYGEILSGGPPRDGIPSIDDPQFVSNGEAEAWLADNEPVMVVEIDGDARAYPLQILTWHEIVNDTVGGVPVVVTFCPLCNSAIVFERVVDGEPVEFGVSGLLRNSDLIMYDRADESLWQQFTGEAIVGNHVGKQLTFLASSLVSFANFKDAFPEGVVLSRETGFGRDYGRNPYAGYDTIGSNPFLFTGELDGRLPAVARVVTVSLPDIDIAYPLDLLAEAGVIHDTQADQDIVVLHIPGTASALGASVIADAEDVGATGVFDPTLDGETLTFVREGELFVDDQTGSRWNILGQAVEGELTGQALTPIVHADHFWFSWAAFRPETIIYSP